MPIEFSHIYSHFTNLSIKIHGSVLCSQRKQDEKEQGHNKYTAIAVTLDQ